MERTSEHMARNQTINHNQQCYGMCVPAMTVFSPSLFSFSTHPW